MPRKKRQPAAPEAAAEGLFDGGVAPEPAAEDQGAATSAPQQERISIPLTPDGKIDFSAMREKTRERLASAIAASGIQSAGPAFQEVTEEEMRAMFGMFAGLQAFYLSARYDVPASDAGALCGYQPDQMALLTGPAARVMTKYGGGFLGRYRDEIGLLMALVYVEGVKMARIRAYLEARERERERERAENRAQAMAGSGATV